MERFKVVGTILVDESELRRFIEWLPPIAPHEAYMLQLMIRTRGLKDTFGFKGGEHAVEFSVTTGGYEHWRLMLLFKAMRLALLAGNADKVYVYFHYKPGTRKVERITMIPREVMALYIQLNPCRWVAAAADAAIEVLRGFRDAATYTLGTLLDGDVPKDMYDRVLHHIMRPDKRFYANCARRVQTRFHVVDLDDLRYHNEVLSIIQEVLGYKPPIIWTARGAHYLIPVYRMSKEQAKKWFGGLKGDKSSPTYRLAELMKQLKDGEGRPLLEVKEQALEPLPGTIYKATAIVRFEPEEK